MKHAAIPAPVSPPPSGPGPGPTCSSALREMETSSLKFCCSAALTHGAVACCASLLCIMDDLREFKVFKITFSGEISERVINTLMAAEYRGRLVTDKLINALQADEQGVILIQTNIKTTARKVTRCIGEQGLTVASITQGDSNDLPSTPAFSRGDWRKGGRNKRGAEQLPDDVNRWTRKEMIEYIEVKKREPAAPGSKDPWICWNDEMEKRALDKLRYSEPYDAAQKLVTAQMEAEGIKEPPLF